MLFRTMISFGFPRLRMANAIFSVPPAAKWNFSVRLFRNKAVNSESSVDNPKMAAQPSYNAAW
jgi:hypothetical protein